MAWWSLTSIGGTPPAVVADTEGLARSVHRGRHFKKGGISKGEKDKVFFWAFEPPSDPGDRGKKLKEISVDRCQYLTESEAVELGCERAPRRGGDFFGWALVTVGKVRTFAIEVLASPALIEGNLAHADLVLPEGDVEDKKTRNSRLVDLATACQWQDVPAT